MKKYSFPIPRSSFLISLAILTLPMQIFAQVTPTLRFTEIMYDLDGSDTGREWVELYNYGADPIAISTGTATTSFRFFDGSNHTLKLVQGDAIVHPGGFAVLVDNLDAWLLDHAGFMGTIFDTVLSLKNTSSTVGLSINTTEPMFTSVGYDASWGAAGDGHTLEKRDILSTDETALNWTVSTATSGTPGFWEPLISTPPTTTATTTPPETPPPPVNNNPQQPSIPPPHWSHDIIINEALPNPAGADSSGEWTVSQTIDSRFCRMRQIPRGSFASPCSLHSPFRTSRLDTS